MTDNLVILRGNLTRDPEIRYTAKGTAVGSLGIAVNESWIKDGQKQEKTTFINVTAWKDMAEKAGAKFKKGATVIVIGRLTVESWEKGGQNYSKLVVTAESITSPFFATKAEESSPAPAPPPARPKPRQKPQQQELEEQHASMPEEDDVPF